MKTIICVVCHNEFLADVMRRANYEGYVCPACYKESNENRA